jgi:competence protein ComEA
MRFFPALTALACLVPLAAWAGPVDINTADAATLAKELKGIGPARAQAIVAYRNQNGPFKSADDLVLVKSISQKVVDNNRDNIRLDGARGAHEPAKPAAKAVTAPRAKP